MFIVSRFIHSKPIMWQLSCFHSHGSVVIPGEGGDGGGGVDGDDYNHWIRRWIFCLFCLFCLRNIYKSIGKCIIINPLLSLSILVLVGSIQFAIFISALLWCSCFSEKCEVMTTCMRRDEYRTCFLFSLVFLRGGVGWLFISHTARPHQSWKTKIKTTSP